MDIDQQLGRLTPDDEAGLTRLLSAATVELMRTTRFYGELVARLPRVFAPNFNGALGLGWRNSQVVLLVNGTRLVANAKTATMLLDALKRIGLALVFEYPLKYPQVTPLQETACRLVLDQYVGPVGELARFNHRFGLHLPAERGADEYAAALHGVFKDVPQLSGDRPGAFGQQPLDATAGWPEFKAAQRTLQAGTIRQLVHRAFEQTPAKSRGTLPGGVHQAIARPAAQPCLNWRDWIRQGIGRTAGGTVESTARFNRRQPYRMELPGKISGTLQPINVFVDHSGSMGDQELGTLLNGLGRFLDRFSLFVTVFSFDAAVHEQDCYQAGSHHQIRFVRSGGGGTSFQAIFYFLARSSQFKDTLTLILTDGQGEKHINTHGIKNVVWLLSVPKRQFSLRDYPGVVTTMGGNEDAFETK